MMTHRSIADIPEGELVEELLGSQYWRNRLLGIRGIYTDSISCSMVSLTGLPGQPKGDIDILLCPPDRPHHATAVQVKRIKVGAAALRNNKPNKLAGFLKGVKQANRLAELGFHQAYLYCFVVVDSREQNAGRDAFDGLREPLRNSIERTISTKDLNERVGLMHYEFVQPTDGPPLEDGMSGAKLVRLAKPGKQPVEVTAWVASLMRPCAPSYHAPPERP